MKNPFIERAMQAAARLSLEVKRRSAKVSKVYPHSSTRQRQRALLKAQRRRQG